MGASFSDQLRSYAEVILDVGLNLQSGQRLLIGGPVLNMQTPIEAAPLVRLITESAYKRGARLVEVIWGDQALDLIRLQNAPADSFAETTTWQTNAMLEYFQRGDAVLALYGQDPDLLNGQNPENINTMQRVMAEITEPITEMLTRNATNWLIGAVPVPGWAAKLFPGLPPEEQVQKLWEVIFYMCRVDQSDPVAAWKEHIRRLEERCNFMNRKQYARLHLTAPGTDLMVGLPARHLWRSGQLTSERGVPFVANLPTEEIFCLPHKDGLDGTVTATKPLSLGGALIEDFRLEFRGGKVVDMQASGGREILQSILDTDEGARRAGEIALVPYSSPVSQLNRLFYNILIDENAANHIALGHAYTFNLSDSAGISDEEFMARGGNISQIHLDFMVGSNQMDVDGITAEGKAEPVMRGGEWADNG